jgi:DNA ligase (NAD+)
MNATEAQRRIKTLSEQLHYHNELYYMKNRPEISDYDFDMLLQELIALEEAFPQFKREDSPSQRVGGTITKEFPTVKHKYRMYSLDNTYSEDEVIAFVSRVERQLGRKDASYYCELKYDGVAMNLSYENGLLKLAATRGDGEQGDEITNNAKTIRSIPLKINVESGLSASFEVRGEVVMPISVFQQLNKERDEAGESLLANPRNTAAGTLKLQDSSEVSKRKLLFIAYGIITEDNRLSTHAEGIDLLREMGFFVPDSGALKTNVDQVMTFIHEWETKRRTLDIETDGCVVKVNEIPLQEELGYTAKSPRWAMAYKYKAESASTRLKNIVYQVGRTGAITPVAELEPVKLAGTIVKRASLHNANEIERLGLHYNDTVYVEKGGEIIPKITGVNTEKREKDGQAVQFPSNCPECGTPLVRAEGEAVHYCPNEETCPPQQLGRIEHFISRKAMDIDSLGPETLRGLIDHHKISNYADLFDLQFDDIHELEFSQVNEKTGKISKRSLKEKSASKIIESIRQSKKQPFENVLFALGIRHVGKTVAQKLARHFGSIQALMNAGKDELEAVPEIGEKIAESILLFFGAKEKRILIQRLAEAGLQMENEAPMEPESSLLAGKKIVISGVFSGFSRDDLKLMIERNGGENTSSLSAKTDYLVAGENMGPAKKEKAEKLGIPILSEEEFLSLINPTL